MMVRQSIFAVFVIILSMGLIQQTAVAKRFGGGKSIGKQSSSLSRNATTSIPAAGAAKKASSGFLGALGGFALGSMLGSLLFGNGGIGFMGLVLIALIIGYLIFKKRGQVHAPHQYVSAVTNNTPNSNPIISSAVASGGTVTSANPPNFNKDNFLRESKTSFVRLQAAYDMKNLTDLQSFTTNEVFSEISMQLNERGEAENKTIVTKIDADLIGISQEPNGFVASVRFTGMISEDNHPAEPFNEIWHFEQSNNGKWLVAGIEQQ